MQNERMAEEARLKKTLDEINRQLRVKYNDKYVFEKICARPMGICGRKLKGQQTLMIGAVDLGRVP